MLCDDELDRYARHIVLREVGGTGQLALKAARVLVVGAGGIGSGVLPALVAGGVGMVRLVDDDVIALSNLHRQTLFTTADIGAPKVAVAAQRLTAINPHVTLDPRQTRVTAGSIGGLLADIDLIIDGSDNFMTRLIVSDAATHARIPLVSAAIAQFQGQVGTFTGWLPDKPCYRCFVGDAHDPDDCDSCAEQGVLGAMVTMVGAFAALEAMRQIIGFGDDAPGKLHVIDGLRPEWRTLRLPKEPRCRTCADIAKPFE